MKVVRCLVCRRKMPTLKYLNNHYLKDHSKVRIVKFLMKFSFLQNNLFMRKHKKVKQTKYEHDSKTMYMNSNFKIVYGTKEIMIADSDEKMELQVGKLTTDCNEELSSTKENIKPNDLDVSKATSGYCSDTPAASSDSSSTPLMVTKKKIRRRKTKKNGYYQINITKIKNEQSLSEENGQFYICHCRESNNNMSKFMKKSDLRVLTSDTESCSDTGKQFFMPIIETKMFCKKCGSGYKTATELDDHMSIHDTVCNLCNITFSDEFVYKEHMRLHVVKLFLCHVCKEEFPSKELLCNHFEQHVASRILENVLDMEDDYGVTYAPRPQMNYSDSISNIICYLKDGYDLMKIVCDICGLEVFVCDYEQHIQSTHCLFGRM